MAKINYIELNKALRPINKNTIKAIERNSAKYILVNSDRTAKCERCDSEFILANAKHRSKCKCPNCNKEFEVIHTWRKKNLYSIHWEVSASVLSDSSVVMRYYLVTRNYGKIECSEEKARLFLNTDKKESVKFENQNGEWKKSGRMYFREFFMCYQTNRFCCLYADFTHTFFKEIKKLNTIKYLDLKAFSDYFCAGAIGYIITKSALFEKLQKIGLNCLIVEDLKSYDGGIKFDNTKSELTKMLGINKNCLNLLIKYPSMNNLRILQKFPEITEREFMALKDFPIYQLSSIGDLSEKIGCTVSKVANYIKNQGASIYEYNRYIHKLECNGYNLKDKSYSMPKDMAKEMDRIIKEEERKNKEFAEIKDKLIKAVRDKLNSMPELKEFFNGAKGFMAYVPQCENDFIEEGKAQHNCVGGGAYANQVAKNQTLIFFIREIDKPNAPFVTMEYRNGKIIQCMLDRNERVKENTKVYDFCSALANRLNKCNVLSA